VYKWSINPNPIYSQHVSAGVRNGAGSVTHVHPVTAPEPGIGAKCIIRCSRLLPWTDQGNRYLLSARDYFTKWSEAYAIPNQETLTLAEALVANFCRFGVPRELHSDQGVTLSLV
jgi:hypothetical protein